MGTRSFKILITMAILMTVTIASGARAQTEQMVKIKGGGWGHGIGMSQYGAYGRALNGKSANKILEHYYSGANVKQVGIGSRLRVGLLPAYGSSAISSVAFSSKSHRDGSGLIKIKVAGTRKKIVQGYPSDSFKVETSGTGGFKIFKNGDRKRRDGKGVFGDLDTPLVVKYEGFGTRFAPDDKSYEYAYGKGSIESYASDSCANGICARLVLKIPMQKYLYGLGEVPSSWPDAVLQSQAIAGRTYAYEKKKRPGLRYPCGCDVYDTVIDQAYIGDAKRTGSGPYWSDWKGAVKATKDRVILNAGAPIQALYSSSSGGHTENNENVWGGTSISYLRGVPDGPDSAGGANPNHKWTVEMTWAEFSTKLNSAYNTGALEDFEIVKPLGVSGRVTVVKDGGGGGARVTGSNKVARVSGWSLRSALGLKDSLFTVEFGYTVGRKFRSKYSALEGAPGSPTGETYRVPKGAVDKLGFAQNFTKGRMVKDRRNKKVTWQYGRVLKRYNRAGREKSNLGMPRTDIRGPGSYLFARYENGRIVWSSGNGAHPIIGKFDRAYARNGKVTGPLGAPVKYRQSTDSLPGGGRRQLFEHGALYKVRAGGPIYALWGKVAERYRALGEGSSDCGYPTGDASGEGSTIEATFEQGTIVWESSSGVTVDCSG